MLGMAGELGHINVEAAGAPCGCGSRGCLEQYASALGVKRMAAEAVSAGKSAALAQAMNDDQQFNAKTVYELAMRGDAGAQHVFQRFGTALGIGQ
jgi:glucokinase